MVIFPKANSMVNQKLQSNLYCFTKQYNINKRLESTWLFTSLISSSSSTWLSSTSWYSSNSDLKSVGMDSRGLRRIVNYAINNIELSIEDFFDKSLGQYFPKIKFQILKIKNCSPSPQPSPHRLLALNSVPFLCRP